MWLLTSMHHLCCFVKVLLRGPMCVLEQIEENTPFIVPDSSYVLFRFFLFLFLRVFYFVLSRLI